MATQPKTAAQYIAEATAKQAPVQAAPAAKAPKLVISGGSKANTSQDPISWLTDILSRPLYAVTDSIKGQIEGVSAGRKVAEEGGDFGQQLGAELNQWKNHNAFTGLFSTDKANKSTTSDLIERGTDVQGELDPNYKDTANNVNPVLKGVLGFAGDVVLDPTTWIPGAQIAKLGKLGLDAVKGGKGALKVVENAATATKDAGQAATKLATDVPVTTETAAESAAKNAELPPVEAAASLTPAERLLGHTQTLEKKAILAIGNPKSADIKTALASIKPFQRETAMKATGSAADTAPLKFQDWLKDANKEMSEVLDKNPDKKITDAKAFGGLKVAGEVQSLPIVLAKAQRGDVDALEALGSFHRQHYTPGFLAKAAKGKLISPLGKEITPVSAPVVDAAKLDELSAQADTDLKDVSDFEQAAQAPDAPSGRLDESNQPLTNGQWIENEVRLANESDGVDTHDYNSVLDWMVGESDKSADALEAAQQASEGGAGTVLNAMQAFKSNIRQNEAFVRGSLGNDLVDNLKKYTNPGSFDKAVSELGAIMDGSVNITKLKKITPTSARLLQRLGFEDPASIPVEMKRLQDAVGTVPLPPKGTSHTQQLLDAMNVDDVPQEMIDAGAKAINETVLKNLLHPSDPLKYPFTTRVQQAARTDEGIGEGVGRILDEANTYMQGDLGNSIMASAVKLAKDTGAKAGLPMAMAKSAMHRQTLRLSERALDREGIPLTLGTGDDRILLGGSQVLDILDSTDANALTTTLYNFNTAVPLTKLYDAVELAVKGGDRAAIEGALLSTTSRYGRPIENNLANPVVTVSKGRRYQLGTKIFASEQLTKMLADTIERATPTLQKTVEMNAAAHEARGLSETMKMTNEQLQFLELTYGDEKGFSSILSAISDTGKRLDEQAAEIGAMRESTYKTAATLDASIPVQDMTTAYAAEKMVQTAAGIDTKLSKDVQIKQMLEAGNEHAQQKYESVITEAAKGEATPSLDLGDVTQRNIASGWWAMFAPLSRTFGNKLLHDDYRFSEDTLHNITSITADGLAKVDKAFSPDVKLAAYHDLQNGVVNSDPNIAAAAEAYKPFLQQIFGDAAIPGADTYSLKDNSFFRENTALFHLNQVLDQKGLGDHLIDVDKAAEDAKVSGRTLIDEAARQWMQHDVKDPSAYLNKMMNAMATVHAHHTLSMEALSMAKRYGATSKVPKEGFVRLTNDKGRSVLSAYLPKDVYFQKDIAQQIGVVDSLIRETLDLGGPIGSFVRNVYKPALDMFKTGMTIINPSHQVRNAISDMDLTRDAEGITARPIYKWAMEAIATRNEYDGFDAIAALADIHARPKPGRVLFTGKLAPEGITPGSLYEASASRGVLPNYRRLENLDPAGSTKSFLGKLEDAAQNTKPIRFAASVSEANSHYTRLAHMAQFVEKNINNTKEYKSLDDLWRAAAIQVKKWHPDGSDLGTTDQIMRLIIPFYSWQRKSIPLVLETFLTHPARAEVLPKASYNLAVAMGVNPDSLSDPFPQDQLFPSYLTEKTFGPQFKIAGKYYGINPGFASSSTLDQYLGNNPLQSILGQTAPAIRAPFELATGANAGTGSRINDTSDYIDSQLPIVAPLSRLTGISPTGSALSLLQGKGLDPQYQIAQGNKDPATSSAAAFLNYLTGAGLTPMSQPNQINYAEIEKRNAAAGK